MRYRQHHKRFLPGHIVLGFGCSRTLLVNYRGRIHLGRIVLGFERLLLNQRAPWLAKLTCEICKCSEVDDAGQHKHEYQTQWNADKPEKDRHVSCSVLIIFAHLAKRQRYGKVPYKVCAAKSATAQ